MNLAALSLIALAIAVTLSCTTTINAADARVVAVSRTLVCGALTVSFLATLSAQINSSATFLTYAQASPVFAALDQPSPTARDWDRWIAAADAATRARVAHGDESSIVNLLLFG